MFPDGAMLERVRGADQAGLQVLIHAIGDRANDQVPFNLRAGCQGRR
jgi:predicted amidohydrolase YtcJ